ncbi:hypothetical protein C8Q80DRAFT_42231 [Daedaleopsis nitida]|nr:hypothetical protein C8Q80DRAFT_42231 [Daedaleopsis nitida]
MDEPFRRPRNWNVLHALESLNPPSPSSSTSLDALASLASSGEIPIFLHRDHDHPDDNRSSLFSLSTRAPSRASSANLLKPSSSLATFQSTNTFGMPDGSRSAYTLTRDDASDHTARSVPSPRSNRLSARPQRGAEYWNNRFSTVLDVAASPVVSAPEDSGDANMSYDRGVSPYNGFCRPSPSVPYSICTSDSIVISPADDDMHQNYPSQLNMSAFRFPPLTLDTVTTARLPESSSHSLSSASSASSVGYTISPAPSTAATAISEDFNVMPTIRFRSPLLRDPLSPRTHECFPYAKLGSYQPTRCPSPQSMPASPCLTAFPEPPPAYNATDAVASNSRSGSGPGTGSGSGHSRSQNRAYPVPDLPDVLSWLRDICIELWIDQEGFRAIRPKFRLAGYTSSSTPSPFSSTAENGFVDTLAHGVALFRPVRRETSAYHHGTLDSTPVLRRLTLADSEDKDYISRQANLTIKSNGVYVVTGTESFDDHPLSPVMLAQAAGNILHLGSEHSTSLQLQWRFEYVVDDRKADTGRLMPGEKTLTPLSFSCSPGLLHHSHGKRIRLMYVLMKNITPKLSAARMDTPDHSALEVETDEEAKMPSLCCSPPEASHRRTRSSEPSSGPPSNGGPESTLRSRRRSLSGAILDIGHQPQGPVQMQSSRGPPSSHHGTYSTAGAPGGSSRLSRQILSREELAAILASFPNPSESPRRGAGASPAVRALSPPSYYRHRRTGSASRELNRVDEMGVVLG